MKRALLIGRYQPPHMGHVKMIQAILEDCDELVIVVAAAQMSFSKKKSIYSWREVTDGQSYAYRIQD